MLDLATSANLLNLEELCIEEKKYVWVLYADIVCLSHDGNLTDAINTVLYAALKNTKLPLITMNQGRYTMASGFRGAHFWKNIYQHG